MVQHVKSDHYSYTQAYLCIVQVTNAITFPSGAIVIVIGTETVKGIETGIGTETGIVVVKGNAVTLVALMMKMNVARSHDAKAC